MNLEPTAKSFTWGITSGGSNPKPYELAIFAETTFGESVALRTVYRTPSGNWIHLMDYVLHAEEEFDTTTTKILGSISKKVQNFFMLGEDTPPIPTSRLEQIEALLSSGVKWEGNELQKVGN